MFVESDLNFFKNFDDGIISAFRLPCILFSNATTLFPSGSKQMDIVIV